MLADGIELTLFGIGFVALFLSLLYVSILLLGIIIKIYFPDPPIQTGPGSKSPGTPFHSPNETIPIAVISAAISRFRQERQRTDQGTHT